MTHAFVTVIVPFEAALSDGVDQAIDGLGNPARQDVAHRLNTAAFVHFMSMIVVPAREKEKLAHLVIEVCADGHAPAALARLVRCIPDLLSEVLKASGHTKSRQQLGAFLESHRLDFGIGWPATAGVAFTGTPGMTLDRIDAEARLAKTIRELLDKDPAPRPALAKLNDVREAIFADAGLKWAFLAEPAALLDEAQPLAESWWPMLKAAIRDFLWPLLLPPVAILLYSRFAWESDLAMALWHAALTVLLELMLAGALIMVGYRKLRAQEKADVPSDEEPRKELMDEILAREDHKGCAQNHLAGVSILKPGGARRVTLRLALWLIGELEVRRSRPGHLNRIGSIHFALWFCLPKTDKLVFVSNYDGSWQSYLEDFIARLREGLTTIWSNTRDFPKTESLYRGGAGDSTRFKRWARRQQLPTRFWYTAYPQLTTSRIRTNAEIRRGLLSVSSESEAARWLALFGYPLPETLDSEEIPTLVFGGFASLRFSHCLLGRLGDDRNKARDWLRQIEGYLSYGEHPAGEPQADETYSYTNNEKVKAQAKPGDHALVAAFTCTGLRALLDSPDETLATFPMPFQQGMAQRSRLLGDEEYDSPKQWKWGGTNKNTKPIDVLLMVYAKCREELQRQVDQRKSQLRALGDEPHEIVLGALDKKRADVDGKERYIFHEPFGFRDGVSQPVMRGSRRWSRMESSIHSVEPGELVLGYRDNLGTQPPLPRCNGLDLGRNGTFLVVRQLQQHTDKFDSYADEAATALEQDKRSPQLGHPELVEWIKAKMVGRWRDGTSLVKYPDKPGSLAKPPSAPDNAFLFGREDPDGLRCPLGAHVRRANPRDSFEPGSQVQLGITNRHRILRVGRAYKPEKPDRESWLLFMCVNADIERQFEFLQQTWLMGPSFHGLNGEVDPMVGPQNGAMTVPTPGGPVRLPGLNKFVTVLGGAYFFMPSRRAVRALAG